MDPSLGFTSGGGWFNYGDAKVNFGFNAKILKSGQVQGSVLTIFKRPNGNYIIKSNSLSALGFTQTTGSSNGYPMTSTLQGKCNAQINRASDGVQLYSQGNLDFIAKATDSGLPSSNSGDALSLTLSGSSLATKSFTDKALNGGNIVIHIK